MKYRLDDGQIEVVDDAVAEVLRRKTPAERVAMIFDCNRTMRLLIEAGLQARHGEWDETMIHAEVARRMSGGTS
ncbi:MAG: hypothetical protein SVV80_11180 [Planctomycetota bacterium]|nr:hypothetical protein [Planctomycetota bacterium]